MRGFPNRMLYPDYKGRYQILGAAEIANAKDNKEGVYALMDKIEFSRDKYRLGHTKVFFRAGALSALEEARDNIVLKLVRWMQAECYMHFRLKVYHKKRDQRELMKVIQRNFRKYQSLRNWGWFVIIQKTKPLIGQVNMEEELRLLAEKADQTWGKYKEQLDTKEKLQGENVAASEEIKALMTQLESEQGDLSKYTEKQAKFSAQKADLEAELSDASKKLALMESSRQNETSNKKALEQQNLSIKKDIEDLELAVQKLEQEKCNRDYIMRQINDEIASQDEIINKLNKEKKHVGENSSKATEDSQAAEDKVNHLNNIKSKLEQTMDQLIESYEKEKRARADIEKQRRKKEGELKIAQESVADLERSKKELESSIARKEKDISDMSGKLDDEQGVVGKTQKGIKEIQARVEELEEELEAERQARAKAERQRSDLARELEQLGERLNEAGGVTAAQRELNKKREAEVNKLRKDLEEAQIQQEATMTNLKRKHQDAVAEMSEQIDQLSKMKGKIEKDRNQIMHE